MSKDILPYSLLFQQKQYGPIFYDVNADYVKDSLRFNYIFPVAEQYITKRDFNKETAGRKEFIRRNRYSITPSQMT